MTLALIFKLPQQEPQIKGKSAEARGSKVGAGVVYVNCSKTKDKRLANVSLTPPRYPAC